MSAGSSKFQLLTTEPFRELIGTTPFRTNFLEDRALYVVDVIYDNQDNSNIAQLRAIEDQFFNPVPPASLGHIFNEVRKYVEVVPDGTTGSGILTCALASKEELKKVGLI